MKTKIKIIFGLIVFLFPFSALALSFPDININTKAILWASKCGVVETKASQKAATLDSRIDADQSKHYLLHGKLENIKNELKSRGYDVDELEDVVDETSSNFTEFMQHASSAYANLYALSNACDHNQAWTTDKIDKAREDMKDAHDDYNDYKYLREDISSILDEMRNNRVASNH